MIVRFLPLAITNATEKEACVGAIADDGSWLRPEPVFVHDVAAFDTPYIYFHWISANLSPSVASDRRPEDRNLREDGSRPELLYSIAPRERLPFLEQHLDPSVECAFAGNRSLGLVRVSVRKVYAKLSTGGRLFLRTEFTDQSGTSYDWIIPEVTFNKIVQPYLFIEEIAPEFCSSLLDTLQHAATFFAVGLTKPNFRFPGRFRGCHPLVVGIHSEPAYDTFLRGVNI